MTHDDTIVAISSAVGPAARMIIRISGPESFAIASKLCNTPPGGSAARRELTLLPDPALPPLRFPSWIYAFKGPRSYTGQDLIELHIPGNPLLARITVEELERTGCRSAEPGEFTARAYFNGQLNLAEAEGVASTVTATSEAQARAARQLMAGELARRLRPIMDGVAECLALVEAGIDFVDEGVSFLQPTELQERVTQAQEMLEDLLEDSERFDRLSHEPRFVLVGRSNAGKSTLLNTLAGYERAVVSPVAGTTRDALSADVMLPSGRIHLIDVAGLETLTEPGSTIDQQMQQRALKAVEVADRVVLVRDVTDGRAALELPRQPDLVVWNKTDCRAAPADELGVSGKTGAGLELLRERLDELAFSSESSSQLALNARHVTVINEALTALDRARTSSAQDAGDEVVAMELRESLDRLGDVLGAMAPDDVLGLIFSKFCIGK